MGENQKEAGNDCHGIILQDSEAGFGLLSVIVALGVGLVVAQMLMQSTSRQLDLSIKSQSDYEFASIQRTIVSQLDCVQTLGITDSTIFPMTCGSFSGNLALKRVDGSVINPNNMVGRWSVKTSCVDDELMVGISRDGRDSITKKLLSSLRSADDAFRGASDFCKSEFKSASVDSDLVCFTASRSQMTVKVPNSKAAFVDPYDRVSASSGEAIWGLSCKSPFLRVGCYMDGPGSSGSGNFDSDVRPHEEGCNSDDEEWRTKQNLHITCCSIAQ